MVGEIRDSETATIAVRAALTGHLVLSSIHANNAVGVLFRLVDLGIPPFLVASTLIGVSAQRMVRLLCQYCREAYQPTLEELATFDHDVPERPPKFYTTGAGCNSCNITGFQGRTGLFEVMVMSDAIRNLMLKNASSVDIRNQATGEGMITMRQDGLIKARQGITSITEVLSGSFSIG
jgi:general secretion pathway protein E